MSDSNKQNGYEIFCKYIVKNGKIIRPKKGKVFHFFVDERKK